MSGLIEDSSVLIYAFALNLFCCLKYMKKIQSHRYVLFRKGKGYFNNSDN